MKLIPKNKINNNLIITKGNITDKPGWAGEGTLKHPVLTAQKNGDYFDINFPDIEIIANEPTTDADKMYKADLQALFGTKALSKLENLAEWTDYGDIKEQIEIAKMILAGDYKGAAERLALNAGYYTAGAFIPFLSGKAIKKLVNTGKAYANVIPKIFNKGKNFDGTSKKKRTINALWSVGKSPKYVNTLNDNPLLIDQFAIYDFKDYTPDEVKDFSDIWKQEVKKGKYHDNSLRLTMLRPGDTEDEIRRGFQEARSTLNSLNISDRYVLMLKYQYDKMYKELSKDPVFKSIIDESPLYINEVYNFYKNGNLNNKELFVKDLIKKTNSYRRFMNRPYSAEDFLKLNGNDYYDKNIGSIDVEGRYISGNYGEYPAYFQGLPEISGPIETWWSLRIPKEVNVNRGMHDRSPYLDKVVKKFNERNGEDLLDIIKNFYAKSKEVELPRNFYEYPLHLVFSGPKGSTLPNFKVTVGKMPNDFTFGLGYKNGGKLKKNKK